MTASSGNQFHVGTRKGYVFPLTAAGVPAAASPTVVYEGIELSAIKGFDIQTPDSRRISHVGNDRVAAVDFLPSLEPVTGEIRVAPSLQTLNSTLTNVNKFAIGNAVGMPWQTEDQGTESDVGLVVFQQSLDVTTKLRAYRGLIVPRARAIPMLAGMNDNPGETRYSIIANPSTTHLWGTALATGTEGATEAAVLETMSAGRPHLVAWLCNNSATVFTFPADKPAIDTNYTLWLDGVLTTANLTKTVTDVTNTSTAYASGKVLVILYEY
jgi:hypothetical protein